MAGRARLRVGDRSHDVEVRAAGRTGAWTVVVDGSEHQVEVLPGGYRVDGMDLHLAIDFALGQVRMGPAPMPTATEPAQTLPFAVEEWVPANAASAGLASGTTRIRAPMSGRLMELRVRPGMAVAKGDVLFVLEAMKMQNEVRSPAAGVVAGVHAQPGETLDAERVVVEVGPVSPSHPTRL